VNEEIECTAVESNSSCALCGAMLPQNNNISICSDCIKIADCCTGLEKLSEES
jgi:hypothetical protein